MKSHLTDRRSAPLLLALLVAWGLSPRLASAQESADPFTGSRFAYIVRTGDSLLSLGARFGITPAALAQQNQLAPDGRLKRGAALEIENRHIIPTGLTDGILINVPQRMLYYFRNGRLMRHYPAGLGKPDWPTPTGHFHVMRKAENPTWMVPVSIQEEMHRKGERVRTQVPPGPGNPLGKYILNLDRESLGIHGTIAPTSVYRFPSHGCIRLHPGDIADLFPLVPTGTPVDIVYQPVLLTEASSGAIFLEVNDDIYNRGGDAMQAAEQWAEAHHVSARLDWERVRAVIQQQDGLAHDVSAPLLHQTQQKSP